MTEIERGAHVRIWMDRGDQVTAVKSVLESDLAEVVREGEQAVQSGDVAQATIDRIKAEVRYLSRAIDDISSGQVDDYWLTNPNQSMRANVAMRLSLDGQSAYVLNSLVNARRDSEDHFLDFAENLFEDCDPEDVRQTRSTIHHLTRTISKIINGSVSVTFGKAPEEEF